MINEHSVFLKLVALLYDIRYSGHELKTQFNFIDEALDEAMTVDRDAEQLILKIMEHRFIDES